MSNEPKEPPIRNGYPELARIMGPVPGMSLFKRFSSLSARNLLYKQAELLHLGERLQQMDNLDRVNGLTFHKDASAFMRSGSDPGIQGKQARMMAEIDEKLKVYHETLLRHAQVNKLERANGYDLDILRDWLVRCNGQGIFPQGIEARPWEEDEEEQEDLVALSSRDHDVCTKWIAEKMVPWLYDRGLHKTKRHISGVDEEAAQTGLVRWRNEPYRALSRALSVVTSTMIPSLAVIVLYFIHNLLARIFAATMFSALFAVTLALLTKARAPEIFGATAAFASVQVVFIGSTGLEN